MFFRFTRARFEQLASLNNPGFRLTGLRTPSSAESDTSLALAGELRLRHFLPIHPRAVVNQGPDVPCCVSCAFTTAMETLDANWPQLSSLYQYWTARSLAQVSNSPSLRELTLEEGQVPLSTKGICDLTFHPAEFTATGAARPPSDAANRDAEKQRLKTNFVGTLPVPRRRMITPNEANLKTELLANRPVILGFRLPADFEELLSGNNNRWLSEAVQPKTPPTGHAVLVCGFDDGERAFCVQDSRGNGFGECGKWWMGYRIVNSRFAQAAMTIWA
jgi:hypothetical protein